MQARLIRLVAVPVLLLAASCADSPTFPTATGPPHPGVSYDQTVQGCVSEGLCLLPPIGSGGGGWCDPRISDCGDGGWDTCITTTPPMPDSDMVYTTSCPGGDGGGPGGDGGSTPSEPSDPAGDCNPQYDPDCNQPLTSADSTALKNAFAAHLRPASQFTDPAKAEQCSQMKAEFDRLMVNGQVFRGQFDTPENDPHTDVHVGAYDPGSRTMHFEPSALNAANAGDPGALRNLVNTALHEAAHALGFEHTAPLWLNDHDVYAEAPFNLLSPGTNSCIIGW